LYELGITAATKSEALSFGTAWHWAQQCRNEGREPCYVLKDEMQTAIFYGLWAGYCAKYQDDDKRPVKSELEFSFPFRRGRGAFWAAGKIDAITENELVEYKTTSADISPDSDYWLRLRGNFQVMHYVLGARSLGYDSRCVIYDVTRKPSIRQKQGESVAEFSDRLRADTLARPDFYYARREIPILEDELAQHYQEMQDIAAEILWRRKQNCWPRAVSERTCQTCEFACFCLQNVQASLEHVPSGFVKSEPHAELTQEGQ
jgi:hypothetical protein